MQSDANNGNGTAEERPAGEIITLVFTRNPWSVQLKADATEPLACLAALRCAVDELEAQLRMDRAKAIVTRAAEDARVNALVGRHGIGVRR